MAARRESCQCACRNSSSILFIPAKLGQSICMKEQIYHEGRKCCLHPFKHCSVWSPSQPWAGSSALPLPVQLVANISCRSTGKRFYLRCCEPSYWSVQPRVSSPLQLFCGKTWQPNTRQSHCTSKCAVKGLLHICAVTEARKARGKCRHQILLHLQPKVTMLEGRKERGNVVHTAIQKVGFVPGSSVWQGNKVNVKTTGRHIPQ